MHVSACECVYGFTAAHILFQCLVLVCYMRVRFSQTVTHNQSPHLPPSPSISTFTIFSCLFKSHSHLLFHLSVILYFCLANENACYFITHLCYIIYLSLFLFISLPLTFYLTSLSLLFLHYHLSTHPPICSFTHPSIHPSIYHPFICQVLLDSYTHYQVLYTLPGVARQLYTLPGVAR